MTKITITIPIDPTKGTKIQVEGHSGPGCQKLTEAIEAGLGHVTANEPTEEFGQAEQQQQSGQHLTA
jgi:hypothetical protein